MFADTYLQAVPNQVNPNFIAKAKASDQDWTRKSGFVEGKPAWSPAKAPSRGTVFQEFEYIPSLYTLADELRSEERKINSIKQEQVAGIQPFVCADTNLRLKQEEGYTSFTRGASLDAESSYPYQSNPYEAADDLAARTRWCVSRTSDSPRLRVMQLLPQPPRSHPGKCKCGVDMLVCRCR
eukprot:SAG11_NODE_851_length_6875_cov_8.193034_4_plen_181_part_00